MRVLTKVYLKEDYDKILCEIYEVITYYRQEYRREPVAIILSSNLITLLKYFDDCRVEYNPVNNIRTLFGIECKESPVLVDLEYKVY